MAITQDQYQVQKGESTDAYNTRIAGLRAAEGTQTESDPFISTLQERLLSSAGMVSSESTNIEKTIAEAQSGVEKAREATAGRIESQYAREQGYAQEQIQRGETAFFEEQRGFATNLAAYRQLQSDTDKNLKDLEMRKQELLLANDAQAASQVSQLQLQSLQFRQQAMQNTFNNLLGAAGFALQARTAQQAERQQTFYEQSKMSEIALQYGVELGPNDNLNTVIAKARPIASKTANLQLAKLQAEIDAARATAAKAAQGEKFKVTNPAELAAISSFYYNSPDARAFILGGADDLGTQTQIANEAAKLEAQETVSIIQRIKNNNIPKEQAMQSLTQETSGRPSLLTPQQKAQIIEQAYTTTAAPTVNGKKASWVDWVQVKVFNEPIKPSLKYTAQEAAEINRQLRGK